MNILSLAALVLFVGGSCFISFIWATRGHFRVSGSMPSGMRLVILLSFVGGIWFVGRVVAFGVGPAAPFAVLLLSTAFGLFCWTVRTTRVCRPLIAFADDLPGCIYKTGPYSYVRHPFYLSYILCWLGTSVATRGAGSWIVPAVMGAIYFALARQEEEKFRASRLAGAYEAYRKKTAMFIPIFSKPDTSPEEG